MWGWFLRWFEWRALDEFIGPLLFPSWRQRRNYYRGDAQSNAQQNELSEAEEEIRALRQR